MDKENLKDELIKYSTTFTNSSITCEGITLPLTKYIIDNFDDTPTTEQAWEKIAEIFDDDDPDMLKDVCMNVLKAFNGGYPMLVTEGHICTWNPDVGKPEKEELPDYIIEYLDNALTRGKNKNFVLENLYLELFRKDFGHFYSTSDIVLDWVGISGNATRIIDAIRNGYKPYKRPAWVVKGHHGYLTEIEVNKGQPEWRQSFTGDPEDKDIIKFHNKEDAERAEVVVKGGAIEEWSE